MTTHSLATNVAMYGLDACTVIDRFGMKRDRRVKRHTPLLPVRRLMNRSHSSALYGKVGISDVRASDAGCQSLSLYTDARQLTCTSIEKNDSEFV